MGEATLANDGDEARCVGVLGGVVRCRDTAWVRSLGATLEYGLLRALLGLAEGERRLGEDGYGMPLSLILWQSAHGHDGE